MAAHVNRNGVGALGPTARVPIGSLARSSTRADNKLLDDVPDDRGRLFRPSVVVYMYIYVCMYIYQTGNARGYIYEYV